VSASILDEIVAAKKIEVAAAKRRVDPAKMAGRAKAMDEPCRGFREALVRHPAPAIIAEIKRRSPSKGEIRSGFEPVDCARDYLRGDAACLSILTDEAYFGGHLDYLSAVREAVPLPLLRKDFTVDPYQVDEARVAGADAILLIAASIEAAELQELGAQARDLGLDVLVEVHDEAELELALAADADLIGVNNRDLATFEVDLGTSERLAARIPEDRDVLLVAESGIATYDDIQRLAQAGARAFLVGESLMREPDMARALKTLRGETGLRGEGRSS
jgi:indole-3-glycerol phosphate synthase